MGGDPGGQSAYDGGVTVRAAVVPEDRASKDGSDHCGHDGGENFRGNPLLGRHRAGERQDKGHEKTHCAPGSARDEGDAASRHKNACREGRKRKPAAEGATKDMSGFQALKKAAENPCQQQDAEGGNKLQGPGERHPRKLLSAPGRKEDESCEEGEGARDHKGQGNSGCVERLLAMAYIEAYQATGKKELRETAKKIFTYVLRDMTDSKGGFYSAEDADSEGVEGKFYVWTEDEIRKVLKGEEADLIINVYNIDKTGNFRDEASGENTGANILHLEKTLTEVAFKNKTSVDELKERVEAARQKLFTARNKRIHPHKDDKILTDWNGLMIAALAKGAQVCNEPEYANVAKRAADFILTDMHRPDGRILHRYRDGHAAILANVDDYAFLIWGLLELYETIFDVHYLQTALNLNNEMIKYFWDEQDGGFYFTADDAEELIVRQKEIYDGAIPSGNSVAVLNLLRLSRITADPELEDKANKILLAFSEDVKSVPSGYTQMMVALDFGIGPSYEIVIVGNPQAKDTKEMLNSLRKHFIPNKVVLLRPSDQEEPDIIRLAKFTEYQSSLDGKATAYVCLDYACKMPTTDTEEMLKLLNVSSQK